MTYYNFDNLTDFDEFHLERIVTGHVILCCDLLTTMHPELEPYKQTWAWFSLPSNWDCIGSL